MTINPLLERNELPPFDKITAEDVVSAIDVVLSRSNIELENIEKDYTNIDWSLIEKLNAIEYDISRTWGPVNHLMGVKNEEKLRVAHEQCQHKIVEFFLKMGQSEFLYNAYQILEKSNSLDPAQKRVITLRLRDAKHAGIAIKDKVKKNRFNEIVNELSKLSTLFMNNVLDSTKALHVEFFDKSDVEGLPKSALEMAAQNYLNIYNKNINNGEGDNEKSHENNHEKGPSEVQPEKFYEKGPWSISPDGPTLIAFLQHAKKRNLRERVFKIALTKASSMSEKKEFDNTPIIEKTLKLRLELAKLLDFKNFAQERIDTRMAKNVEEVYALLEKLRSASYDKAKLELEELVKIAKTSGHVGDLEHWDIPYYAERLREKTFNYTEEELRPYFTLDKVLEGLFNLAKNLFDINISTATSNVATWHPDVRFFKIFDNEENHIASFYLDPYTRPENKRGGAWMDDCINRKMMNGKIELPVAYLVCNAAQPIGKLPALMNFREVETLFHEFGHGLQHMLTQIQYPDVSGINGIEWDAVELPSQFMENWCYYKPCLLSLSKHYETGKQLPDDLFEKIKKARNFRSATMTLRQVRLSLLDMDLHTKFNEGDGVDEIVKIQTEVDSKTSLLKSIPEDKFLCSFNHIFAGGYAAGYYSYKWAEVLAADAFSAFEEVLNMNGKLELNFELNKTNLSTKNKSNVNQSTNEDVNTFNSKLQEIGLRFKNTILALGGSLSPSEVFKKFRGREPKPDALLRQLGIIGE